MRNGHKVSHFPCIFGTGYRTMLQQRGRVWKLPSEVSGCIFFLLFTAFYLFFQEGTYLHLGWGTGGLDRGFQEEVESPHPCVVSAVEEEGEQDRVRAVPILGVVCRSGPAYERKSIHLPIL